MLNAWARLFVVGVLSALVVVMAGCAGVSTGSSSSNHPATLALSPASPSVPLGGSIQFNAIVSGNASSAVSWTVNGVHNGNTAYGTISNTGLYAAPTTAPSASVVVTATSSADSAESASATVALNTSGGLPIAVSISPSSQSLQVGSSQQFSATVSGTSNTAVTWLVNGVQNGNSTYGSITSSGLFTAPTAVPSGGASIVTAKSVADSTKSASATVTLSSTPPKVSVAVTPSSVSVPVSTTEQFTATVSGTTNTAVTWFVNGVQNGNSTYGTITNAGLYTAPAAVPSGGVATVTAKSVADSSKSASATVTVSSSTSNVSVKVTPVSVTVAASATQQFSATVSGTTDTSVNWLVNNVQSGNSTDGAISSSGVYTAPNCPSVSTVTVTAQSAFDNEASANSTVTISTVSKSSDRFVATDGSDSNDGSACKPWATLQRASNAAQPGWTIHIMAGTYQLSSTLSTSTSGTASAPITFVGAGYDLATRNWPVKIVHTGTASTVWAITGAYVTVEGIDLSSDYAGTDNGIKSSAAHTVVKNSHIHNIVDDGQGACVVGGSGGDYYTVINNEINDCGTSIGATAGKLIHGIYLHGYYSTIQNNLIYRAAGNGIQLYSYGVGHPNQEPWHSIITNNTIFYCGKGITASADSSGFSDYNDIGNNIVAFLVDAGSPAYGIFNTGANYGTHNTIEYNLVWSVPDARYIGTGLTYTHDVNADPQFVNYQNDGAGDYQLTIASAAVDAGTSHNAPSIDFEGTVRPQGSGYDIGAYESH
jgi:hypothetical protein